MRINFRLNEDLDHDLITAVGRIQKRDLSRLCRDALRAHLLGQRVNAPAGIAAAPQIKLTLSDEDLEREVVDPDDKMDDLLAAF